jgi:serine/threonine-protein kinase
VFKGKVRYMSPEQIGERGIDRRADVFSVGVVLWEMLAGRALYSARSDVASIVTRIAGDDPPLLRTVREDVSPELEAIVARALRRDRDARYSSADEMRADIARALRGRQEGADGALAQTLGEMFAETRDVARARIKSLVASVTSADSSRERVSSSDVVPTLLHAPDTLPPLLGEGRTSSGMVYAATRPSTAPSLASPVLSASGMTLPPARRASFWPWASAGAVALAAIAFILLRKAPQPPPAQATAPVASAPQAPAVMPVHIETAPSGALVEWNGRLVRTPADLDLPPGAQGIRITSEGYEPVEARIDVVAGQPVARAFALRPKVEAVPVVTASEPHRASRAAPQRRAPAPSPSTPKSKIRVLDDDGPEPSTDPAQHLKIRVLDNGTR